MKVPTTHNPQNPHVIQKLLGEISDSKSFKMFSVLWIVFGSNTETTAGKNGIFHVPWKFEAAAIFQQFFIADCHRCQPKNGNQNIASVKLTYCWWEKDVLYKSM